MIGTMRPLAVIETEIAEARVELAGMGGGR